MSDVLARVASWLPAWWSRIPPAGYALSALIGGLALWRDFDLITVSVAPLLFGLGIAGLGFWWWLARRASGQLVVAQFESIGTPSLGGREIQRLVLGQLRDSLPGQSERCVGAPIILGKADFRHAQMVTRRTRAAWLLYGDVREGGEKVTIHPRLVHGHPARSIHFDDITHDVTPIRLPREGALGKLDTQIGVEDVEYPITFSADLEGLILAIDGLLLSSSDLPKAEEMIRRAIVHTQDSMSEAADSLYVSIAQIQYNDGRLDEALNNLRSRIAGHPSPSPSLLRFHAHTIVSAVSVMERMAADGVGVIDEQALAEFSNEAVDSLRQAVHSESDPLRDTSRYNLASVLLTSEDLQSFDEGQSIMRDLASKSGPYRRAWYVHRVLGVGAWKQADAADARGDSEEGSKLAKQAAISYSRAIRLRPRWQLFGEFRIIPIPPIMRANARDAHQRAGNGFRAFWQGLVLKFRTGNLLRRAIRAAKQENWDKAARYARQVVIGTDDHADHIAAQILATANAARSGDLSV